MLKAFNRSSAISPCVSVANNPAPSGLEQQTTAPEPQQQSQPLENGRNSLTHNIDEAQGAQTDGGDGASSAAAGTSVFYAASTLLLRGYKGDLVRLFELPPTERLLGDFHCAMRKRVLYQGRMYIFDHYVCFYSAVFGFGKKRRMPMRTIKAVRKRKHLGFPNSLEIETDDCKEFFTSFLSREEAFQLISKHWQETRQAQGQGGGEGGEGSATMRRSTDNGSLAGDGTVGREVAGQPSNSRGGAGSGGRAEGAKRAAGGGGQRGGVLGRGGTSIGGLTGDRSLRSRNSGSGDDENDDEEDSGSVWVLETRPPPPAAPGSRHVLHTTLPGTPREFFDVVLADSAPFFEDFLDSQGNRRIHLTSWKRHQQLGHVRDLNFTAPIKGAFGNWGVSHTACFQSQRFCLYEQEHIVFESSQTMTNIPYGDCFTVDQRWDVRWDPDADPDRPMVFFDLHVRVPFTNRCLFKSVIESGSVKQVQDTFAQFVEQLRPVMQERLLSRHTLNMDDHGAVGGLEPPGMSHTPRVNSTSNIAGGGSLAARSVPHPLSLSRSMQHVPSFRALTPGAIRASAGFDGGDSGDGPLGRQRGEPSVGRLLLSLGGRLVAGARGVLESGVDVVLNMTQCRTTPQMRFLVALVILMFLANALCMLGFLGHGWGHGTGGGGSIASPPATPAASGGSAATAFSDLAALLAGGGSEGAAVVSYWVQRMAVLQQEMQMLQSRMEILSEEVGAVMAHLTQAAAGPATAGAGLAGEL